MSSQLLNHQQAHWSMFLSEFNFQFKYEAGHTNLTDAPSR
jgi:hypothetical protein